MNAIVLISDSFRRDHLGCYGNPWIHTPHLDRLAEQSAVFEQYYAASYPTVPNRWDLCTGRFGFTQRGWEPLERGDVTWGQILSRNGVYTQMIWDTPMLGAHDYNYTKGFQGIEFVRGQKGDSLITDPRLPLDLKAQAHKIRNPEALAGYLRNHHGRTFEREYCVGRTVSSAMDWIETNYTRDPFLLWVDMWDPHEPFDCPSYDYERYADPTYDGDVMHYPEYGRSNYMTDAERQHLKALYAGNVTLVDRWMGAFLDMAERLGLFQNTLIIWASDHGHLFGDHDLQGKPGGELGRLYEVTARIPLLVRHPDGLGAGQRVSGIVQPPDVLPTVLEAMGVGIPNQVEGRSFLPLMDGSRGDRPYAFSSRFPPAAARPGYRSDEGAAFDGWVGSDRNVEPSTVTGDEWAYIAAPVGMSSELYNLRDDPNQTHNVLEAHDDVAATMREAWIEFLAQHGASDERIRPFLDGSVDVRTPRSAALHAIRDDQGLWIAFETEQRALRAAHLDGTPGPRRSVEEVTFGALLDDNPRNLIHAFGQYYWAEDFAS